MVLTPEDIEAVAEAVVKKIAGAGGLRQLDYPWPVNQSPGHDKYSTKLDSYSIRAARADEEFRRKVAEAPAKQAKREARKIACLQEKSAVSLRLARNKEGVSQEQLAELTGIPLKDIGAFERGRKIPNHNQANLLSKILNVADYQDLM